MRAFLFTLLTLAACADEPRPLDDDARAALVARWEATAAEGDPDAQFHLAFQEFMFGDQAAAVPEFERLAEAGHLDAIGMAAAAYQYGWAVEVDYERSAYWLEKAAALGDEGAARDLAAYRTHKAAGRE